MGWKCLLLGLVAGAVKQGAGEESSAPEPNLLMGLHMWNTANPVVKECPSGNSAKIWLSEYKVPTVQFEDSIHIEVTLESTEFDWSDTEIEVKGELRGYLQDHTIFSHTEDICSGLDNKKVTDVGLDGLLDCSKIAGLKTSTPAPSCSRAELGDNCWSRTVKADVNLGTLPGVDAIRGMDLSKMYIKLEVQKRAVGQLVEPWACWTMDLQVLTGEAMLGQPALVNEVAELPIAAALPLSNLQGEYRGASNEPELKWGLQMWNTAHPMLKECPGMDAPKIWLAHKHLPDVQFEEPVQLRLTLESSEFDWSDTELEISAAVSGYAEDHVLFSHVEDICSGLENDIISSLGIAGALDCANIANLANQETSCSHADLGGDCWSQTVEASVDLGKIPGIDTFRNMDLSKMYVRFAVNKKAGGETVETWACFTLNLVVLNDDETMLLAAGNEVNEVEAFSGREEALAQEIVDAVNESGASWTAHMSPRFQGMTAETAKVYTNGAMLRGHPAYDPLPPKAGLNLEEALSSFRFAPKWWHPSGEKVPANEFAGLPEHFDSREQWPQCSDVIGHVRDQADCGSCWAFAATEALNDRKCIQDGSTQLLSTQDTAACCAGRSCGLSFGCMGGQVPSAWRWFTNRGVVSGGDNKDLQIGDTCQPYSIRPCAHHVDTDEYPKCRKLPKRVGSCEHICQEGYLGASSYQADKTFAEHAYSVSGEIQMMKEIYENGPISCASHILEDFYHYHGGIYHRTHGKSAGGHAYKVIGWGTDKPGGDYWLCVNSWNHTWGEEGFFRIRRGHNEGGLEIGNCAAGTVAPSRPASDESLTATM